MNGYDLTRNWFNFKFENIDECKSIHTDLYMYIVDLWNRLGQKEKFGLPTSVTMEALGIGSYNTYKKTYEDLVRWEFIQEIKKSKNQHQSRVIALSKNDKALDKALDKANAKALDETPDKSPDIIDKQITTNKEQGTILKKEKENFSEQEFLEKWIQLREKFTGKQTHFKKLSFFEKENFRKIKKTYSRDEIEDAMHGIFIQENLYDDFKLRPTKFLEEEMFGKVLTAFRNNDTLYKKNKINGNDKSNNSEPKIGRQTLSDIESDLKNW